jgi:hypothetical protein
MKTAIVTNMSSSPQVGLTKTAVQLSNIREKQLKCWNKVQWVIASNGSYKIKQVYLASTILGLEEDHADI